MEQDQFSYWAPLDLEKSVDDGARSICGIISTEDVDLDGERVLEQGASYAPMLSAVEKNLAAADKLDFSRFCSSQGFLKYEHNRGCPTCGEASNIVGVPTRVEKGVTFRAPGTNEVHSGTALWGQLFAPGLQKSADDLWNLMVAIKKSGFDRRLGYSIEGAYLPGKDPVNKSCLVTNVVITPKPVQSWTWADLAKALVAGPPGVTDVAQLSGGAALRRQSLNDKIAVTHQGATPMAKCGHMNERGKLKDKQAAYEHARKCLGKSQVVATAVVTYLYPKSA